MRAATSGRPFSALPTPRTWIIGREDERETARAFLLEAAVPLLTLTGPGGVGKTRLALQIAADLENHFRDGACLVSLAEHRDPEFVPLAIAHALEIPLLGQMPPVHLVRAALHEREVLLLLDNCEHLLAAAPFIADLLRHCPHLTILATSRERLRLGDEQELRLSPLSLPDRAGTTAPDELAGATAIRLFMARAQAVLPGFVLNTENAAIIAEICRRVDGLPLALELAAARVPVVSPALLLERLESRLPLLVGGNRDAPARHQTMRATIAWSYGLLSPEEQAMFRWLAVFAWSAPVAAIEAIVGAMSQEVSADSAPHEQVTPEPPAAAFSGAAVDVLDLVGSLRDKSLLTIDHATTREPRVRMLQIMREFALERLRAHGEETRARQVHAAWYLAFSEQFARAVLEPGTETWLDRAEAEALNIQATLEWFVQTDARHDALRLAGNMWEFWHFRAHLHEGIAWLERALRAAPDAHPALRAKALAGRAMLAWDRGDLGRVETLANESLTLSQQTNNIHTEGLSRQLLGMAALGQADVAVAETSFDAAHRCYATLDYGRAFCLANVQTSRGLLAFHCGDLALAEEHLTAAVALSSQAGHQVMRGIALQQLARVQYACGEASSAAMLLRDSLTVLAAARIPWMSVTAVADLAIVAGALGEWEHAARLCGAVEHWCQMTGAAPGPTGYSDLERARETAQSRLGNALVAAAWQAGRTLSFDQMTAEALALPITPPPTAALARPAAAWGLSEREEEVLRLIAAGHTNAGIAHRLSISPRTASTHAAHILAKCGVASRGELIAFAHANHLV